MALAPSLPTLHLDESVSLRSGVFDSREYGVVGGDPMEQPAMPDLDVEERQLALRSLGLESRLARDERKRGIVIRHLACPLLVVTGELDTNWPRESYAGLHLPAEFLAIEACSHWGLVAELGTDASQGGSRAAGLDRPMRASSAADSARRQRTTRRVSEQPLF